MAKGWSGQGESCLILSAENSNYNLKSRYYVCYLPGAVPIYASYPCLLHLSQQFHSKSFLGSENKQTDDLAVVVKWRVQMKTRKKVRIENALGIWDKEVRFLCEDSRDAWRQSFSITQVSDWTYVASNQWDLTLPDTTSCRWHPVPLLIGPRDEGSDSLAF